MKRTLFILRFAAIFCMWLVLFLPEIHAACRNPNVAGGGQPWIRRVAASRFVEIRWFGHAFFQITSSAGTKIITDPFRYLGYPIPEVWPDVVTVGKETPNHSNVSLAKGKPLILRGLKSWGVEWNEINTVFRDVLIYNVPVHMRAPEEFIKGSAFDFELDGLCICHTSDIGEPFNEGQLDLMGHIDVAFVPIGGAYTMGPEKAKKVVEQLKPKIAVPMHYYDDTTVLERFLEGPYRARFLETNAFSVSKDTLPAVTEIFIPKVSRQSRADDL